jgi:transcriptional regulator with XRE-family HTH domain
MRKTMPLRNLRRVRTLNQEQLADIVGITQQSLSKIEKGLLVPSVDVQERLAAILGASRAELGFPVADRGDERIPA